MPANLNALIRYRTIDQCLSNPYRKWTIGDLGEACAAALKEHRGIYSGISERTIREDIRVMRSDILGFNAPIIQSGGHYSYEDRNYSIFKVTIEETGLLTRILDFILEIRSEIKHPELEMIIESITNAISDSQRTEEHGPASVEDLEAGLNEKLSMSLKMPEPDESEVYEQAGEFASEELTWAGIFKLIE